MILITVVLLVFISTVRGYKKKQNKWLQSFDLISNMKHFKVREGEHLNVWDGVRALAMMWVVIGHVYAFWLQSSLNISSIVDIPNKPFLLIIEAGLFAVDIFFCLGGFFLAFIMLRNKITFKLCGMGILQRALRIWPAYILAMMIFSSIYMQLGSGPFWSQN